MNPASCSFGRAGRLLARIAPGIPRVAVGLLSQPEGAIAALRAGVSDFVDPSVAPQK